MVMEKKTVKTEVPAKAKKVVPAAKKAAAKKPSAAKKVVDIETIRKKAEEIYHNRIARGEHGTAEGDWHHAEQLLKVGGKSIFKKEAARKPAAKKPTVKKPVAKKK
jgi:hypothetical protein